MNTIDICKELHQNFIDFAYEANSERAFPDVRDGLKPGQRACLWEMYSKGYTSNKPHVKSAKISGGTIASFWPHGDVAVYETFARMSQPWINNIPEVDWHGSNGNIVIGSAPASSRYTEARLSKVVEDGMLQGLKKKNVPMILNFSEDEEWPEVLPAVLPRLLINGSQGIGVTIANTWLPMNFKEVSEVIIDYLNSNIVNTDMPLIDFPSGGIIINKDELSTIHKTGEGRVVLRAKTEIKNNTISILELPYQVYVEPLIESIKKLVENNELSGIKEIYNKTDKKRLLIEIECSENPRQILKYLFSKTDLQKVYNANQWALLGKTPKLFTLSEYIKTYVNHNIECILRESNFDLEKALNRLEIVDGLLRALESIDAIIALIKKSASAAKAQSALIEKYDFTENQAKAIVNMKLGSLANLEKIELEKEGAELAEKVENLNTLINSEELQKEELKSRLKTLVDKYGNNRRSELTQITISKEDKEIVNVEPEKCVVVMTESGLIKRIPASSFKTQKRNGKGVKTQDDITKSIIRTNTIDNLMIFTNKGKMYKLLVDNIPIGNNVSQGYSIKEFTKMDLDEEATVIYSIYRDTEAKYVLFVTKNGLVKKTPLEDFIKTRKKSGISAITIREDDELVSVFLVKDEPIILITNGGMAIKFKSTDINPTGRNSTGVKGITLKENDFVRLGLPVHNMNDDIAIFSEHGLGTKFTSTDLPIQGRSGKGLICYKPNNSTGNVVSAALVSDEDSILVMGETNGLCIKAKDIPRLRRTSAGNQIIKNNNILNISKV